MKLKILICALLLISTVFSVCGCVSSDEIEFEGVIYKKLSMKGHEPYMTVFSLTEGYDEENAYVYDEINGIPVVAIGNKAIGQDTALFYGKKLKRIYFPWSIENRSYNINWGDVEYIFSPSSVCIVDHATVRTIVLNKLSYDQALNTLRVGEDLYSLKTENLMPANISFKFNYLGNPNEGYFFIDLLEEGGILVKPPYDPKREGYTFAGWYTEEICINEWNFETDTVKINFDEEGNRIYEEIKLYAKWEKTIKH